MKSLHFFTSAALFLSINLGNLWAQTNNIQVTGTTTGATGNIYHTGGNLGIGTTSPTASLHINTTAVTGSETLLKLQVSDNSADYLAVMNGTSGSGVFMPTIYGHRESTNTTSAGLFFVGEISSGLDVTSVCPVMIFDSRIVGTAVSNRRLFDWRNYGTTYMTMTATGHLLIGKTSQTNDAYKLDVSGSIRANEVVVNTTGADFVFENNYQLPSLSSVEAYIKANKHLPSVASASDMQQNGVGVSELQTSLLQKVEELTLYIIELEKRINELENKK